MQTKKYRMKDLTYGWKRYTYTEFKAIPTRTSQRFSCVVLFFKRTDGTVVKVLTPTANMVRVVPSNSTDPDDDWYYAVGGTFFVKVPVKVGRFIP